MIEQWQLSGRLSLQTTLIVTALNALFCLAVATLISFSGSAQSWWLNIQIAFGFGFFCQASTMLVTAIFKEKATLVYWAIAVVAGLCFGSAWAQYVLIKSSTIEAADWTITLEIFLSGVGFTGVALGIHYNYLRQARTREKLWQAEIKQLEHSRELAQSKLKTLQAQIEPHFLFNSLASIQALISVDPEKAEQMLNHLSVLLRGVLQGTRSEGTTLAYELTLIKAYLDIQQIRLGSRLIYRINTPELSKLDFEFPVLLLQPLVENAVGHGIEPSIEGGEVTIDVEIQGDRCRVIVKDTGVGLGNDLTTGQGIGVANIRARLDALHADKASLTVSEGEPSGTVCILEVPYDDE